MTFPTQPDSLDTYGGPKADYIAVVDPRTDRSSDEVNAAFQATAMMTETSCQAMLQFTGGAGPTIVPSFHRALWGSSLAVIPGVTNAGSGVYTVTFPASFTNALGEEVDVNLKMGRGGLEGSTFGFVNVAKVSANVLEVRTGTSAGAANDLSGVTINVWAY